MTIRITAKRTARAWANFALALCAGVALHDAAAQAGASEAARFDVPYFCDAQRSSVIIGETSHRLGKDYKPVSVDLGALVIHGKPDDAQGEVRRTGSQTASSPCGELTVSIQGGFYNANPQGEMGADNYAVVSIHQGKTLLVGPVAIGECEAGNPRYEVFAQCPRQWAATVRVYATPHDSAPWRVELRHAYTEIVPPAR